MASDRNIDSLRLSHRQMYLEIQMLSFLYSAMVITKSEDDNSGEIDDLKKFIDQAVRHYQDFDRILYDSTDQWMKIYDSLEKQLNDLSLKRSLLIQSLKSFFSPIPNHSLDLLLKKINERYQEIVDQLKVQNVDLEQIFKPLEELFNEFLFGLTIEAGNKKLQKYCGLQFSEIMREAEICSLYYEWEKFLQKQIQDIPKEDSVRTALRIKNLLFTTKDVCFQTFFSNDNYQVRSQGFCFKWKELGMGPQAIFAKLIHKTKRIQGRIIASEEELYDSIGQISDVASAVIRCFTLSVYYKTADILIDSQEKAFKANKWRYGSVLATPLSPSYLNFSKALSALGLVSMDIAQWRMFGISKSMLSSLVQQINPSANRWIDFFRNLNVDEKTTLIKLPLIQGALEYGVFIGINGYSDYTMRTFVRLTLSYLLALGAGYGCGKLVDKCFKNQYGDQPLHEIPSYALVRGLTQWIAFPIINGRVFPYVFDKLNLMLEAPPDVLQDEATCLANREQCNKEARLVLGLPENASISEVKDSFRKLVFVHHPDKNGTDTNSFMKITNAKKLCLLLEN